jgi:S1-C subfamily serine protease
VAAIVLVLLLVGAFFAGEGLQRLGSPASYSRQPQSASPFGRSNTPTTPPSNGSNGLGSGNGSSNDPSGGAAGQGNQNGQSSGQGGVADPNSVAAAINPGVVDIVSWLPEGIGAGTGMVLTPDGEILTNNHVIDGAEQIQVTITTTGDTYDASVVGTDASNDVAVLKLKNASGLTTVPIGDSDQVQEGDPIVAIGNAGGQGGAPTVVTGSVVALHQQITASEENGSNAQTLTDTIQVNANIEPGDSGGPLVNADAKVIGMDSAAAIGGSGGGRRRGLGSGSTSNTHAGFAIPINHALDVVKQIEAHPNGSPTISNRGFLGVSVTTGSDGATVVQVQTNSPAAQAGIKSGDVITSVDGNDVSTAPDVTRALSNHKPGDQVDVQWQSSDGQQHQQSVTLSS